MTQQTLAQMVRAKFPGAYDDLSDQQLESSVKAKFPGVYDDLPLSSGTTASDKRREQYDAATAPVSQLFRRNPDALQRNAPTHLGMATALATRGLSVPLQMGAAGLSGAVGQGIKDASTDMPVADRFTNMAFEGLKNAGFSYAGQKVVDAAPRIAQQARSMWLGAAKITKPVAKNTQTMRTGGSFDQGKDEIAETVLSQGAGTLTRANVLKMRETLSALDDEIDTIVANSTGLVSRQELRNVLARRAAAIPQGSQAAAAELAAIARTFDEIKNLPVKMTVAKAQEVKRYIYRAYEKTFAADSTQAAAASADKLVGRQLRTSIAREEPLAAGIDAQMSRQIPATKALEEAVSRTANHSAVGLTSTIAGGTMSKLAAAGALLNNPKVASFTAQRIYNIAKALPKSQQTPANIMRIAAMTIGEYLNSPEVK